MLEVSKSNPLSLAFLGGRGELVFGAHNGRVEQWQPGAATRVLHDYGGPVHFMAAVPGSRKLVLTSDRIVDVWDPDRGTAVPLEGHTLQVNALHVSADGRRILTSGRDNLLRVFTVEAGELLHTLTPNALLATPVVLSDDGQLLAASTHDAGILLWDLGGGPEVLREPRLLKGHTGGITVLRFAPDARSLLSIDFDGRVIRWADDLPRDPDGLRTWIEAHHDPLASAPPPLAGCIARPADAPR